MKKLTTILILFSAFFFLPSCEKESEMETDITIIENQLKLFVDENDIDNFTIYLMYGDHTSMFSYTYPAKNVIIKNGFITVKTEGNDERYNLLYLSRFKLMANKTVGLYFANTQN